MNTQQLLTDLKAIQVDMETSYKSHDLTSLGYASIRASVAMQRLIGTLEGSITVLNVSTPPTVAVRGLMNTSLLCCLPCYREICGDPSLTPEDIKERVVQAPLNTFCEQCHCALGVPTQPLQGNENELESLVRNYQAMLNVAQAPYIDARDVDNWIERVRDLNTRTNTLLGEN